MAENVEMGEFSGGAEEINLDNYLDEETDFVTNQAQYYDNDLLRRFETAFGREANLTRIEAEKPIELTKDDFVRDVIARRPKYLSEKC